MVLYIFLILEQKQKVNNGGTLSYELEFLYDSFGNPVSMVYNGVEYYYIKNLQEDIVGLLDGQGNTVATYSYDSWGKLLGIGGDQTLGQANPLRYSGYYYDTETGFYYISSRYYDPEVGRFISADHVGVLNISSSPSREKNLYAYCNNNPVNYLDVGGLFPWLAIKALEIFVDVAITLVSTIASVDEPGLLLVLSPYDWDILEFRKMMATYQKKQW